MVETDSQYPDDQHLTATVIGFVDSGIEAFDSVVSKVGQDLVQLSVEEQNFVNGLEGLNFVVQSFAGSGFAVGKVRYRLLVVYAAMEVEVGLGVGEAAHFVVVVPQSLALVHMASCMNRLNSRPVEPTY